MSRRLVTAAILLGIVGLSFGLWHWPVFRSLLVIATMVIGIMCTFEMADMLRRKDLKIYRRVASWGVFALMLEAAFFHLKYSFVIFGLAVLATWIFRMRKEVDGAWQDLSGTCFTLAYIGVPMAALVHLYTATFESACWLLLALFVIWSTDSFALFAGRLFGRHKLWPKISPGKTWEGAAGGLVGAIGVVLVAWHWFPGNFPGATLPEFIGFALMFSIVSQYGDLAESLIKRDVGVKDSGSGLTGHGGFLDLMDAAIFTAVPLLAYVMLFHPNALVTGTS